MALPVPSPPIPVHRAAGANGLKADTRRAPGPRTHGAGQAGDILTRSPGAWTRCRGPHGAGGAPPAPLPCRCLPPHASARRRLLAPARLPRHGARPARRIRPPGVGRRPRLATLIRGRDVGEPAAAIRGLADPVLDLITPPPKSGPSQFDGHRTSAPNAPRRCTKSTIRVLKVPVTAGGMVASVMPGESAAY